MYGIYTTQIKTFYCIKCCICLRAYGNHVRLQKSMNRMVWKIRIEHDLCLCYYIRLYARRLPIEVPNVIYPVSASPDPPPPPPQSNLRQRSVSSFVVTQCRFQQNPVDTLSTTSFAINRLFLIYPQSVTLSDEYKSSVE